VRPVIGFLFKSRARRRVSFPLRGSFLRTSWPLVLRSESSLLLPFVVPALVMILKGEAAIVLKLLDQKTQVFLVSIALTRWFPEHARKVFGEMPVMT
jgi:hypothetical protein